MGFRITDDGAPPPSSQAGSGLTGMRERVVMFDGDLGAATGIRVVAEAPDGRECGRGRARRQRPDVVPMDVRMPGMDGIEATASSVEATSSRVRLPTTFDMDAYAFADLRAGAAGFLLQEVLPAVLGDAIRAVARGDAVLPPRVTRVLVDTYTRIALWPHDANAGKLFARLTLREQEVFHLIASGLSNAEIADPLRLTEATVKTHITRVLAKLQLRDRVQVVIFSYAHNLRP